MEKRVRTTGNVKLFFFKKVKTQKRRCEEYIEENYRMIKKYETGRD